MADRSVVKYRIRKFQWWSESRPCWGAFISTVKLVSEHLRQAFQHTGHQRNPDAIAAIRLPKTVKWTAELVERLNAIQGNDQALERVVSDFEVGGMSKQIADDEVEQMIRFD